MTNAKTPAARATFLLFCPAILAVAFLQTPLPAADALQPEKLLPPESLFVASAPDFPKLTSMLANSPQARLWTDAAMKPFVDKFTEKWREEFVKPLERELKIDFKNYAGLAQGQLTIAALLPSTAASAKDDPGLVLILDTKDKASQLKTNLTEARSRWIEAGRQLRTEKIRDQEFYVLTLSTNDMPKTLARFLPRKMEYHELGEEAKKQKKSELFIGQTSSFLIMSTTMKAAEQVVARASGNGLPLLAEQANFTSMQQRLFRDAPMFVWVNTKAFIDMVRKDISTKKENSEAPSPVESVRPEKAIDAAGFAGLKSLGISARDTGEGLMAELFLNVPESSRTGVFSLLSGEAKETMPPQFVPGDVIGFTRVRMDGQRAWKTLEKMVAELSPQSMNGLNFLLDTANMAAKEKDPGFDIRKNLIGNLGDDVVMYQKSGPTDAPGKGPSLTLVGSAQPEQLAASLKSILIFLSAQAGTPTEREFLGRKIFSVPLPNLPMQMGSAPPKETKPQTLHYTAGAGYVGFSTDAGILEEFLRNADTQGKALRETPGLTEAQQKVAGPGTWYLSYEDQAQEMRNAFELARKSSGDSGASALLGPLAMVPGFSKPEKSLREWMDFSLLPPFDRVAKYFGFALSGLSANSEGISYKAFAPVPAGLKPVQK